MENTIETNGEPVTIKITIEIVPGKKKEESTVKAPDKVPLTIISPTETSSMQSYKPEGEVIVTSHLEEPEMTFEPIIPPEKKRRAYTKKAKAVKPVVEEPPVEEKKPEPTNKEPVVKSTVTPNPNKVVARLAQMIRFYCKASGIETSTITSAQLKEKAFDIVENVADDVINEAIKEASEK